MARYIDADALRDKLDLDLARWLDSAHEYKEYQSGYVAMHDAIKLVIDAPTIDVEPVRHGYWEERPLRKFQEEHIDVCSVCGGKALAKYNYCPNCGAKMGGGKE